MLVMKRRAGEAILIGDEIRIHIAEIGRTRIKLAIEAPRSLAIVAQEVKLTGDENRAAAANIPADLDVLAAWLPNLGKTLPQNPRPHTDEKSRTDPTDN